MARKREFDEQKVLDALRDVFWEYGYEASSYAHIMSATGLKKGSLYAAFGDKRALYLKAISQYSRGIVDPGVSMLRDETLSGKERIGNLFQSLVEAAETPRGRWGCLLCNAAADQAPFDKPTEASVLKNMERLKAAIHIALQKTQAPNIAEWIWAGYFGGHILVKSGATKDTIKILKQQVLTRL